MQNFNYIDLYIHPLNYSKGLYIVLARVVEVRIARLAMHSTEFYSASN